LPIFAFLRAYVFVSAPQGDFSILYFFAQRRWTMCGQTSPRFPSTHRAIIDTAVLPLLSWMSVLTFSVVEKAWVSVVWRHWAPPRVRVVAKSQVREKRMPHCHSSNVPCRANKNASPSEIWLVPRLSSCKLVSHKPVTTRS
jgi:hypothetical protein